MENKCDVTIIGPAIIDVLAGPIGNGVFEVGSLPMEEIRLTYGGNAYNEAAVLSHYGIKVDLISKVGNDEAGNRLVKHISDCGIDVKGVTVQEGLTTGINIVLVDETGERRFLTNPNGSLRKLSEEDVIAHLDSAADIVCFSCMFISPLIDIPAMERIFKKIKNKQERILVVDMTKAKKGEKIEDLYPILKYIDFILPNEDELRLISGESKDRAAKKLLEAGVKCVIVKTGKEGCTVYTREETYRVSAYKTDHLKDTTGAGDCFAAGFIYGLCRKMGLKECVKFANASASCCVEHMGATEGIQSIEEPMRRYELLREK